MIQPLTKANAEEVVLMLMSGIPLVQAVFYFFPEGEANPAEIEATAAKWARSKVLQAAVERYQGDKRWQDLSLADRIKRSLDKHYADMAYFLYSSNYADLSNADQSRADKAREALEAKLRGSTDSTSALARFVADITEGRIKLPPAPQAVVLPSPPPN